MIYAYRIGAAVLCVECAQQYPLVTKTPVVDLADLYDVDGDSERYWMLWSKCAKCDGSLEPYNPEVGR